MTEEPLKGFIYIGPKSESESEYETVNKEVGIV